jgi:hypothetical protein
MTNRQDRQAEKNDRLRPDKRDPVRQDEDGKHDTQMRKRHQKYGDIADIKSSCPHPDVPQQEGIDDVQPDLERAGSSLRHHRSHSHRFRSHGLAEV